MLCYNIFLPKTIATFDIAVLSMLNFCKSQKQVLHMKALVLGCGVIGVTTAYELAAAGLEVTVVEREEAPAQFTSFANAGLVTPAHAYAWANPSVPLTMLKSLIRKDTSVRFKPSLDPALWRWTLAFLGQCTARRAAVTTHRKAGLCLYSLECLKALVAETGVEYDRNTGGLIYSYRSQQSLEGAAVKANIMRSLGIRLEELTPDELAQKDPALGAAKDQLAGGLYAPDDESGDACLFSRALAKVCVQKGVEFKFNTEIEGIDTQGDTVTAIRTDKGRLSADVYVLCLGIHSPRIAKDLDLRLAIYPVKGYSMTMAITDPQASPALGGVDEDNLLAYCPMGNRLRVTATAEISGYSNAHKPRDFAHMTRVIKSLFPGAADYHQPEYWAGLRPMTPQGTPYFGTAKHTNLWLNTGHGHIGWTMAAGSARITRDLILQQKPEIDLEGFLLGVGKV